MGESEQWSNWSGNRKHTPQRIHAPDSTEAVAALIDRAREAGRTVRCRGSAHSFADFWTDGEIVGLDNLQGVLATDSKAMTATVAAGTKVHQLGEPLWDAGMSLPQQGDIDQQSIGGATGTGTHGTGPTLGSMSTGVVAVTLVNGLGETVVCNGDDAQLLQAAQMSLGTLGIITEITLRTVPSYRLRESLRPAPIGECEEGLADMIRDNRHFEFFWTPRQEHQDPNACCSLKMLNIADDDEPDTTDLDTEAARVGPAHRVLPTAREVRFNEMEYAVDADSGWACFSALREMMLRDHPKLPWPVEYRSLAADDLPLSPTGGRASVTISVHQGVNRDYAELFDACEAIFRDFDGRPHWGKVHSLEHQRLRQLYPRMDAFNAVRQRMDPSGMFLNDAMARCLLAAEQ